MPPEFWVNFTTWLRRCWRDPLRRIALLAGLASLACWILLLGPPRFSNAAMPQRFPSVLLEVQTVESVEDLRLTIGDAPSLDREALRIKLWVDFAFIAAYAVFLAALAALLARRGGWRRQAGWAAALCGAAAAAFDVQENRAILALLDVRIADTTEAMLASIRRASTFKWILLAAGAALLCTHFLRKPTS
jgi:hypothetical protein